MGSKDGRPTAQAPLEIQLLDFLYGEWEASGVLFVEQIANQPPGASLRRGGGFHSGRSPGAWLIRDNAS